MQLILLESPSKIPSICVCNFYYYMRENKVFGDLSATVSKICLFLFGNMSQYAVLLLLSVSVRYMQISFKRNNWTGSMQIISLSSQTENLWCSVPEKKNFSQN